jgi:hypothetical protein
MRNDHNMSYHTGDEVKRNRAECRREERLLNKYLQMFHTS